MVEQRSPKPTVGSSSLSAPATSSLLSRHSLFFFVFLSVRVACPFLIPVASFLTAFLFLKLFKSFSLGKLVIDRENRGLTDKNWWLTGKTGDWLTKTGDWLTKTGDWRKIFLGLGWCARQNGKSRSFLECRFCYWNRQGNFMDYQLIKLHANEILTSRAPECSYIESRFSWPETSILTILQNPTTWLIILPVYA